MSHSIIVTTKENVWYAEIKKVTSADSYMPYSLQAPSQTALLALISIVFGGKLHKDFG